jgi:hypothetical protein
VLIFRKGNKRVNRALRGRKEKILCGSQPAGLGVYVNEEDCDLGIGYNIEILNDNVDENMLEHGIDDDDDIVNPFNIVSEPNDDTNVEFDEEDQDIE